MEREDLINGYFEQTLTASDLQEFERRIAEDVDFADEVAFRKQVQAAITQSERSEIKAQLQDFEVEMSATPIKKLPMGRWISIAASLVIAVGASLWFYTHSSYSSNLYETYYQPFPNVVQPIVRGEQASNEIAKAFKAYEAGSYQEARDIFVQYSDENSVFYAGLCEMQLNDFAKAIPYFDSTIAKKSTFVLYAKWYKALALIKLNKKFEAVDILEELAATQEFDLKDKVLELKNELH
jgi:tetratricopeptide (TPR) repeat protein